MSFDGGEIFYDEFATREEAVAYAEDCGGGTIAECQQRDYNLYITDDDIYEAMRGHNEEAIGEGDFVEWSAEQGEELARKVNAVIAAWAEKHKINRTAWQFAATRDRETIEPPRQHPEESALERQPVDEFKGGDGDAH